MISTLSRYGDVELDRIDITEKRCTSIDLRTATGGPDDLPDETKEVDPGVFRLSVFKPKPGEIPVGEIRVWWSGREISIVGHLTNRPGVLEITPDHLTAAESDEEYQKQLRHWVETHQS